MFILRDTLLPLQDDFSDSNLGRRRAQWFVYTLLAIAAPLYVVRHFNLETAVERGKDVHSEDEKSVVTC